MKSYHTLSNEKFAGFPCIVSKRGTFPSGHTAIRVDGKTYAEYRYEWIRWYGSIPKGHVIHHKCENKRCINMLHMECIPLSEHISLHNQGENNNFSKLTLGDVIRLRKEYDNGKISLRKLASKNDMAFSTVQNAISGRTWGNI